MVADPDREVVGDPTSGKQAADAVGGRLALEIIADALGPDLGILNAIAIKRAKEPHAAVRVLLPTVLAIENHRNKRAAPGVVRLDGPADRQELADHVPS